MATSATYFPSQHSFDIDVYAFEATYNNDFYELPPPPVRHHIPVAAPRAPPPILIPNPRRSTLPPALRIISPPPTTFTPPSPPQQKCRLSRSYARRASASNRLPPSSTQYVAWKPLNIVRKDSDDWKEELEYTDDYEEVKMAIGSEDWARVYQELIGSPWTPGS